MKSTVLAEPVLVGRERELEELKRYLDLVIEGKGQTILISGEAGSGKTRLTQEFLNVAKTRGVAVLAGWCLSDAAVPFFPFIEAFNSYFATFEEEEHANFQEPGAKVGRPGQIGIQGQEIVTWLAGPKPLEKMGRPEPLSPQVWRDQAFDRVAKTLLTISMQDPIVLFLEDIQWADSASLALLHYISRVVNNSERILVLATFRSEEVTADAEGHPHQLEEEMRQMSREDLFSEIKISNLSQTDYSMIAQNMMGGLVQRELVEKLAEQGNGNALFLVESLRMLNERKGLVQENNEWRLAVDDFGIPSKIRDIILSRLAVLKYAQRRVLDAASVIGEKFNVELLASVLNQDSLDVLDTLNFIAQSTSIVGDEEAFYKFDHARSREVLYEALSLSLKKGYHARIAERLENGDKSRKLPFADLAYHYAQAGNEEKALKYSLEAGQEALERYSNEEAIRNFQYVIDKIADNSTPNLGKKASALEGLGDALYASNCFSQARETFEQLAHIQKDAAKLRALRKAIVATFYEINPPKIKELVRLAEENASADRVEAARVLSHKARINSVEGRYVDCYPLLQEAISVYEEEYCLSDAAWDLFAMSNVQTWMDELEKGVASTLRSIALHDDLGDIHARLEAHLFAAYCFGYCTLGGEAARFYSKLIEIDNTFKVNDYVRLIPAHTGLGTNLSMAGDFKTAKMLGFKALEYCNKSDSLYRRTIGQVCSYISWVSILEGDSDAGEEYYKKFINLPQDVRITPLGIMHGNLMSAVYFASKNQFDEAHRSVERLHDYFKIYLPCPGTELIVGRLKAWILEKEGRMEESRNVLEQAKRLVEGVQKKFAHVSVHCGVVTFTHPEVDQKFEIRLDLVNASRAQGSIIKVENLIVPELQVLDASPNWFAHDGYVEFKNGVIRSFEVKTIKLTVKATKPETFILAPKVTYMDDLGQTKTSSTRTFTINVQPKVKQAQIPNKTATGLDELDELLLGGIPKGYAVALTAPPSNELGKIVERYIEAGVRNRQVTFYLTDTLKKGKSLAEEFTSDMWLFVCSPRTDLVAVDLPNVFKLKGVENLTEIDIALTKASRHLGASQAGPKRACIEIISDVLLQHHAVTTRKWLSGLIQDLKSKGFTILAVIDPTMHAPEETQAVLGLFDGEISINEKETKKGAARFLRIKRLSNQKYNKDETRLTLE